MSQTGGLSGMPVSESNTRALLAGLAQACGGSYCLFVTVGCHGLVLTRMVLASVSESSESATVTRVTVHRRH
jgi:hypothetical protein